MRKITLAAIAVVILLAATPSIAQPVGTWDGTGSGWCPYPVPYPGDYMKPWQTWKGRVEVDPSGIGYTFKGDWHDAASNHGTFKGTAILSTPTEFVCQGKWTWWDEHTVIPTIYTMGTFTMHFRYDGSSCEGEWLDTIDPSGIYHGTMKGSWVEP